MTGTEQALTHHGDGCHDAGRRVHPCHDRHLHVLPQERLESHPGPLTGASDQRRPELVFLRKL